MNKGTKERMNERKKEMKKEIVKQQLFKDNQPFKAEPLSHNFSNILKPFMYGLIL